MARQPGKPSEGPDKKDGKKIRIKQIKSAIGYDYKQKRTIKGLGLSRPGRSVIREDTPSIRGMCFKVRHLVEVEEVE